MDTVVAIYCGIKSTYGYQPIEQWVVRGIVPVEITIARQGGIGNKRVADCQCAAVVIDAVFIGYTACLVTPDYAVV